MAKVTVLNSLAEARPLLETLRVEQITRGIKVGTVHTLGALHEGHGRLIRRAAQENDVAIVTIYPNKIQLFPGSIYEYSLQDDVSLAAEFGATHLITSGDQEMFSPNFCTYITQGEAHSRLNSSVFPFAARGQITGSIRWILFTRPDRTYFGMKDIEQALLVDRAVKDLMIHTEVKFVPCIRHPDGIPISSRLRRITHTQRHELAGVYQSLDAGRKAILAGERDVGSLLAVMSETLVPKLSEFKLLYLTAVNNVDFTPLDRVALPLVLHIAVTNDKISHFDGLCLFSEQDLRNGPPTIWLEQ